MKRFIPIRSLLCALFLLAGVSAQAEPIVVRTTLFDPIKLQWLQANYDVWLHRPATGQLDMMIDPSDKEALAAIGLVWTELPEFTRTARQVGRALPKQTFGIPAFPCYRTVEETLARMDELALQYPNLAATQNLGNSYLRSVGTGGYPIQALVLGNRTAVNEQAPMLLIGAIHAREYTTAETALRFGEKLLADYGRDPDTTWLLDHRKLAIVPQMNPDGRKRAEAGASWRRNVRPGCPNATPAFGVDLNRNSSYFWGQVTGASSNQCTDTYFGTAPASEPEVQAMQTYMGQLFADQRGPLITDPAPPDATGMFVSLHAYADMVLFPWGAQNTAAPNKTGLQTLARKMGFFTQFQVCQPPSTNCLYAASGTSDDYSYGEFGVASMTFELGNSGFFESCATYESTTLGKMLPALKFALKAARRPYLEPAGPEVHSTQVIKTSTGWRISAVADDTRSASAGFGTEPAHAISEVQMFLSPPWLGSQAALTFTATDGAFNTAIEAVSADVPNSSVTPGARALAYLVATDSSGRAGVSSAVWLEDSIFLQNGFE